MNNESTSSKILGSTTDALNPLSIIMRLISLFVFVIMSAFPYLIEYGNQAFKQISGASLSAKIICFFKVLSETSLRGMLIGFSTVFDSLVMNREVVFQEMQYMTLFYVVLVIIFGTFVIYQPLSVVFNIFDSKKGKHYSMGLAMLVSLILLLVIASPLSWLYTGGETISSGVKIIDSNDNLEMNLNETTINNTVLGDTNNIIDMVNQNAEG